MILAHLHGFGLHGHSLGEGILLLVIVLACAAIIASWPGKSEPK
jgi:hypothetical protein